MDKRRWLRKRLPGKSGAHGINRLPSGNSWIGCIPAARPAGPIGRLRCRRPGSPFARITATPSSPRAIRTNSAAMPC